MILAIDPGTEQSAWLVFEEGEPRSFGIDKNQAVLDGILLAWPARTLVIEMVSSFGMPVGKEVFETVLWIGRFLQKFEDHNVTSRRELLYRHDVKSHLCHSQRAKDANIRQALVDKYGGKEKAIGKKASPGPLYGIKADVWSALAVAVTYAETRAT